MIVLILIYVASIIGAYLTIRRLYSAGGDWEGLTPGISDIIFMFIPGANTIIMLGGAVTVVQDFILSLNIKINYRRFFRIKK